MYPPDPSYITLIGALRVMLASYGLTNPIEEFLGALFHSFSPSTTVDFKRHLNIILKREKVLEFPYDQ